MRKGEELKVYTAGISQNTSKAIEHFHKKMPTLFTNGEPQRRSVYADVFWSGFYGDKVSPDEDDKLIDVYQAGQECRKLSGK